MNITPVELIAQDGVVLRGERWGSGRDWLILLHDEGRDLDCWRPLMPLVAERTEWSALAIDSRGHGGSDDPWDARASVLDVAAAIAHARDSGARAVCPIGAGAGAIAALVACTGDEPPDALALFSPGPIDAFELSELRGQAVSKLFFVGALGEEAARLATVLQQASIGQSMVVNFPTADQTTDLLEGPWAGQALEHLAAFFDEQRAFVDASTGFATGEQPARGAA
jgi:pimeloyl-ACP methyl ester carboxylesterase